MQGIRIGIALIAIANLAACVTAGGLRTGEKGLDAPGVDTGADRPTIDQMLVGHRLLDSGEPELALKAYYRAGLETGITPELLASIGSANLRLGRLGQAEKNLRDAIDLDETYAPAWNNLGVVLMERGEFAEAALVFERALEADSGESAEIAKNRDLALAKRANPAYDEADGSGPTLLRRGTGDYLLVTEPETPEQEDAAGTEQ